jgi:hypothetical protein
VCGSKLLCVYTLDRLNSVSKFGVCAYDDSPCMYLINMATHYL